MSVRVKLVLTLFATGLITAALVIATVIYAFQRFERETAYGRGSAFLQRVVDNYDDLFDLHEQHPGEFQVWLRNMVLFEPDTELYLLDPHGLVLASSGKAELPSDCRVRLEPVLQAASRRDAAFVMGDDPERMDADAVVALQPVRRATIRGADPVAGYLYLVLHSERLPQGRLDALRMSFERPALGLILAVVAFTTLLAGLITASVTRPLRRLTGAVSELSQRGLDQGMAGAETLLPPAGPDEFGQLTRAFQMMLAICQSQWNELRRLDHFRREGVSNLSHDLRSPLTATVACLETLEARWAAGQPQTAETVDTAEASARRTDDRRLVEIALRNTRNAARLVQSLGDLAKLDEPEFRLHPEVVDSGELLADIGLRFAERAAQKGVQLQVEGAAENAPTPFAALDIELFERAVANLIDNALKFCAPGARITLSAERVADRVHISVSDTGPGIDAADLPHLFDRFYQSRQSVAPATGEGGKGLGLAIVKRIVELHQGRVTVTSDLGRGTRVTLDLPAVVDV